MRGSRSGADCRSLSGAARPWARPPAPTVERVTFQRANRPGVDAVLERVTFHGADEPAFLALLERLLFQAAAAGPADELTSAAWNAWRSKPGPIRRR